MKNINPANFKSPLIFKGYTETAYRDPAVVFDGEKFHLFFTMVINEKNGSYLFTAKSESYDLITYSKPEILTEKNKAKNFSSPGNIIRFNNKWVLCLQTYCRENGEKYGNENSRIYVMESKDLKTFDQPRFKSKRRCAIF